MNRARAFAASAAFMAVAGGTFTAGANPIGCDTVDGAASGADGLLSATPLQMVSVEGALDVVCNDPVSPGAPDPAPSPPAEPPRATTEPDDTGQDARAPIAERPRPAAPVRTVGTRQDARPVSRTLALEPAPVRTRIAEPATATSRVMASRAPLASAAGVAIVAVIAFFGGHRTGRRRAEHRLETDRRSLARMKDHLMGNVAHELRTPLAAALGYARLLNLSGHSARRSETFVRAIVQACEKLERTVNLLVDVAGMEGDAFGGGDQVNLGELARTTAARWQERAPNHVFSTRAPEAIPPTGGNRLLLSHAIDELVDNAVKFSPGGGIITITASRDGRRVAIAVSDQGVGIAPQERELIFEDFRQADGSPTRRFGGIGLGLGLVRRVAEAHGGTVQVSSETGKGSTFSIVLPVRAAEQGQEAPPSGRTTSRSLDAERASAHSPRAGAHAR